MLNSFVFAPLLPLTSLKAGVVGLAPCALANDCNKFKCSLPPGREAGRVVILFVQKTILLLILIYKKFDILYKKKVKILPKKLIKNDDDG